MATASSASDALSEDELLSTTARTSSNDLPHLSFIVLGAPGERVDVTVIVPSAKSPVGSDLNDRDHDVPSGVVTVLKVVVGAAGKSTVECAPGKAGCRQVTSL